MVGPRSSQIGSIQSFSHQQGSVDQHHQEATAQAEARRDSDPQELPLHRGHSTIIGSFIDRFDPDVERLVRGPALGLVARRRASQNNLQRLDGELSRRSFRLSCSWALLFLVRPREQLFRSLLLLERLEFYE